MNRWLTVDNTVSIQSAIQISGLLHCSLSLSLHGVIKWGFIVLITLSITKPRTLKENCDQVNGEALGMANTSGKRGADEEKVGMVPSKKKPKRPNPVGIQWSSWDDHWYIFSVLEMRWKACPSYLLVLKEEPTFTSESLRWQSWNSGSATFTAFPLCSFIFWFRPLRVKGRRVSLFKLHGGRRMWTSLWFSIVLFSCFLY